MDLTQTTFSIAELYDVELTNGLKAYFTSHRAGLTVGGNEYQSIPIRRGPISFNADLQVDKLQIAFGIIGVIIGAESYTIPQVIRKGFLHGAKITLSYYDFSLGTTVLSRFPCYVTGDITFDGSICTVNCGSILDRLQNKFPKRICSETCQHSVFDVYCGLTKASYKHSTTAGSGSTVLKLYSTIFAFTEHASGYWTGGEIVFTSGANDDICATVFQHYDGYVTLVVPLPSTPAVGDGFDAYPGCDGTGSVCATRFSNYVNFDGDEYVPNPDVLYG